MPNEPKLKQINACDFYPAQLASEIADFNAAVDHIETARAAITTEATELRNAALTGNIEKPERLPADVAKLMARRIVLDVQEIALIRRKDEFQKPTLDARKAERERLVELEKKRRDEIADGLKNLGANLQRCNEIFSADSQVKTLTAARSIVSGYLKIVTEEDEQRLAVLQGRISAVVPIL